MRRANLSAARGVRAVLDYFTATVFGALAFRYAGTHPTAGPPSERTGTGDFKGRAWMGHSTEDGKRRSRALKDCVLPEPFAPRRCHQAVWVRREGRGPCPALPSEGT